MDKKEPKKGFWAGLFSSGPKSPVGAEIITAQAAKEVKVLGPGCAKCKETYKVVERVITENNLDIKLSKIEDIVEIMNYNIMTTPAVVVDGTVRIKGHVPTSDEVKKVLGV